MYFPLINVYSRAEAIRVEAYCILDYLFMIAFNLKIFYFLLTPVLIRHY